LLRKLLLSHLLTGKEKSRSSSSPALFLSRSELSPVTPPPASPLGDGPRRPPGLPAHRRRSGCSSWSITPPVHLVLTFPRPCPIRSPARALTCARLSNGASRLNKAVTAAAGGARSQGLRRGRVSPSMSRGSAVARDDHHPWAYAQGGPGGPWPTPNSAEDADYPYSGPATTFLRATNVLGQRGDNA
jgi:hypothetical protein